MHKKKSIKLKAIQHYSTICGMVTFTDKHTYKHIIWGHSSTSLSPWRNLHAGSEARNTFALRIREGGAGGDTFPEHTPIFVPILDHSDTQQFPYALRNRVKYSHYFTFFGLSFKLITKCINGSAQRGSYMVMLTHKFIGPSMNSEHW